MNFAEDFHDRENYCAQRNEISSYRCSTAGQGPTLELHARIAMFRPNDLCDIVFPQLIIGKVL